MTYAWTLSKNSKYFQKYHVLTFFYRRRGIMKLLIKTKPTLLHLGAPLNGSSFKRVHCTPFCYSRNVSLCESLWLSYFENITIFWSFHSFRIFVIMMSLYPIPIVFLKPLGSLLECLLVCDRFEQKQADGTVRLDESTKRYAIASRLHIYWWIFMGNTPKDSWFQQLSFEVSILKIRL